MAHCPSVTPSEYVRHVEQLAQQRAYAELLAYADEVAPAVEQRLAPEQLRILRMRFKHAEMVQTSLTAALAVETSSIQA